MLSQAEVTAAADQLTDGKLSGLDVDKVATSFRRAMAGLELKYGYRFWDKLEALDDTANDYKKAAQVKACLTRMETLGFPFGELTGTRYGVKANEKDEFIGFLLYAFSKIYPIPIEWSWYELQRGVLGFKNINGSGNSSSYDVDLNFG